MRAMTWLWLGACVTETGVSTKVEASSPAEDSAAPEVSPGALRVEPPRIDFGTVPVGGLGEAWISLTNVGGAPLEVVEAGLVDPERGFRLAAEGPGWLEPGEGREVAVQFVPLVDGAFSGTAWFQPDVGALASVELLGGTGEGELRFVPSLHDFGQIAIGAYAEVTLELQNAGGGPVEVAEVRFDSTDPAVLSWVDPALGGQVLLPGESRPVVVSLRSPVAGAWEAHLEADAAGGAGVAAVADVSGRVGCACPPGWEVDPSGAACRREVRSAPLFVGEPSEVCAIEPYVTYGMFGARYWDGFTFQDPWWGQNDGVPNGRLNDVGVWRCAPGSDRAGHDPVGEWIGFQVCVTLEEAGTYLVGMGADNRFRFLVDGALVWEEVSGLTQAFNYWWIHKVELEAGEHVFEFRGLNDGAIAGLGTELYGPFDASLVPSGAAAHALDLRDDIAWSTLNTIGRAFELDAEVGWYCPDGAAVLDLCGEEPECLSVEVQACE
jgi:hypothetical protein